MKQHLLKPWYVFRPGQVVRRVVRGLTPAVGPRTVPLPWRLPLTIDPAQMLGRSVWYTGVFELLVSETLFRLVDPGDLAVDVGANIGYMASILGLAAGPEGRLVTFEPHPGVFRQLQANVSGFRRDRRFAPAEIHNLALGAADGEATLYLPADFTINNGGGSMTAGASACPGRVAVTVRRLDALFGDARIGVMKLDVEGYEERVLAGAARLLTDRRIRDLVFEDHHGAASPVIALLRRHGYHLFRLDGRLTGLHLRPADEKAQRTHWESPSYLATCEPDRARDRCNRRGWRALRGG